MRLGSSLKIFRVFSACYSVIAMNVMTTEISSSYILLVLSRHFVEQEEIVSVFETGIVEYMK
jgi:hypothetical protein